MGTSYAFKIKTQKKMSSDYRYALRITEEVEKRLRQLSEERKVEASRESSQKRRERTFYNTKDLDDAIKLAMKNARLNSVKNVIPEPPRRKTRAKRRSRSAKRPPPKILPPRPQRAVTRPTILLLPGHSSALTVR